MSAQMFSSYYLGALKPKIQFHLHSVLPFRYASKKWKNYRSQNVDKI